MVAERDRLLDAVAPGLDALRATHGAEAIRALERPDVVSIDYPVLSWPRKIQSFNFDKQALVEGTLTGIKGQYLMLDSGVINLRKFAGYQVTVDAA